MTGKLDNLLIFTRGKKLQKRMDVMWSPAYVDYLHDNQGTMPVTLHTLSQSCLATAPDRVSSSYL